MHTIRTVSISDTHGLHRKLPELPPGDVLIHAGDFTNTGEKEQIVDFMDWFASQNYKYKILIAGNHDTTIHKEYYESIGRSRFHRRAGYDSEECRELLFAYPDVFYLEDSGISLEFTSDHGTVHSISVYGSPWQPEFCDWAFNLSPGPELLEKWRKIPTNTDILITHGPPFGFGDLCSNGLRAGCQDLLHEIRRRVKPKLHVCGHIHEGYGLERQNGITYVNASTCTWHYCPTNPAIVVDIDMPSPEPV